MDTGRRRSLLIVVGIVLALIAGAAAFMLGSQGTAQPEVATQAVLVAAREVPARTTVTADDFIVREIPEEAVLTQAYTDNTNVIGRVNSVPIYTGQQITPNLFATGGANEAFSILEPDEVVEADSPLWRAVSIMVPPQRAVGGDVVPGSRVDVFVTVGITGSVQVPTVDPETGEVEFEESTGTVAIVDPVTGEIIGLREGMSTKIAFQDLQVLKVNAEEDIYTLKVSLHQAEEIAHVLQEAPDAFGLALRPSQDTRAVDPTEYGETSDRIIMEYLHPVPQLLDLETLLGFPITPGTPDDPGTPGESPQPPEPSPPPDDDENGNGNGDDDDEATPEP